MSALPLARFLRFVVLGGVVTYYFDMSTLSEIESATRRLPAGEKQQLLILIAQMLRDQSAPLPEPRAFSAEQMGEWMDEDESDLKDFQKRGRSFSSTAACCLPPAITSKVIFLLTLICSLVKNGSHRLDYILHIRIAELG